MTRGRAGEDRNPDREAFAFRPVGPALVAQIVVGDGSSYRVECGTNADPVQVVILLASTIEALGAAYFESPRELLEQVRTTLNRPGARTMTFQQDGPRYNG